MQEAKTVNRKNATKRRGWAEVQCIVAVAHSAQPAEMTAPM
jgi:hypothetical protein